jgi:serine/threonine-protein kinase
METPPTEAPELRPGDMIVGKFRLERVIGRGGMGSVWAARQVQLDMPVALKFIETEEGVDLAEARIRFEREARAAGQIRSPHVVQILDHGIDGDRPYIVMELLEGEDLGARLRRERRISCKEAARVVSQAAKALKRAHEAGIIHRDLKPGNVFLARFDDDEVVKLLDFGVAKIRRAGALDPAAATRLGIVFGSPAYMSPEQARGAQHIDHRTDLWSLAVILYRAITGVKPFEADSLADLVVRVCIDPLPVATRSAPDLPPAVDAFFMRAFARDSAQRFATAPELAAAFDAAIAVTPEVHAGDGAPPEVSARPAASPPLTPLQPSTDPTPGSGVSSLPSGGWGFAPLAPAPVPASAPIAPAPVGAPTAPRTATPESAGPSRAAVIFAACTAVATLVLAFSALISRRATPAEPSTAAAVADSARTRRSTEASEAAPEARTATEAPSASANASARPLASVPVPTSAKKKP